MRITHTRAPLVLALVGTLACGKHQREAPEARPAPSGPTVSISVDDGPARAITLTTPTDLTALVTGAPPSSWLEVIAATDDDRTLELASPATSYPGATLRLYLDQGRPAVGVFRPVPADLPADLAAIAKQPLQSLIGVTEIAVRTHAVALPALTLVVGGTSTDVASRLPSLSKSGTSPRERGWSLAEVIGLAVPAGTAVQSVRLVAGRTTTPLPPDAQRGLVKLTRHGQYVFRMWDNPKDPPVREVRGITAIEIDVAR